ncbi:c-type cytochrome [Elioraea sp.]|uniref:c-type cytochrome n=1 Tax=Elioraea sp. TaxID=2185103 RepID=UPI003F70E805
MRLALLPVLLVAAPALAADGAALFETHCASCHAAVSGAPAGAGPNLGGLMGRAVASDPDYDYSPVLRAARDAGEVWDPATLERFLRDPEAMFPGIWMGGTSLRGDTDRAAIAAYLAGQAP